MSQFTHLNNIPDSLSYVGAPYYPFEVGEEPIYTPPHPALIENEADIWEERHRESLYKHQFSLDMTQELRRLEMRSDEWGTVDAHGWHGEATTFMAISRMAGHLYVGSSIADKDFLVDYIPMLPREAAIHIPNQHLQELGIAPPTAGGSEWFEAQDIVLQVCVPARPSRFFGIDYEAVRGTPLERTDTATVIPRMRNSAWRSGR